MEAKLHPDHEEMNRQEKERIRKMSHMQLYHHIKWKYFPSDIDDGYLF